jgi:hypothetical protein
MFMQLESTTNPPLSRFPVERLRAAVPWSTNRSLFYCDAILASHMQDEPGTFFLHAVPWYCHVDYLMQL